MIETGSGSTTRWNGTGDDVIGKCMGRGPERPSGRGPALHRIALYATVLLGWAAGAGIVASAPALPQQGATVPAGLDGALGGAFYSLAHDDMGRLYAAQGARLVRYRQAIDGAPGMVEDASSPVLDSLVRDVAFADGTALLALENGFQLAFDRGPVLEPSLRITTFGPAISVATGYGHGYVTLAPPSLGVQVFEVSGGTPRSAGVALEDVSGLDITIADRLLFVSSADGITVASLARPDRPTKLGVFASMPAAGPLATQADTGIVLAGGEDMIWLIDARAPIAPTIRGSVPVTGTVTSLAVHGAGAVATLAGGQVVHLDISDPDAPAISGAVSVADRPAAVVLLDQVAHVAAADSFTAVQFGAVPITSTAAISLLPRDVVRGPGPLYAAAGLRGLAVIRPACCLRAAPTLERYVDVGGEVEAVASSAEWVAALTADSLVALSIAGDPYVPSVTGSLPLVGSHVAVTGDSALVTSGDWIRLVLLSDPEGPTHRSGLGSPPAPGATWELGRIMAPPEGPFAYVADRAFGVRVFRFIPPLSQAGGLAFDPPVYGSAMALDGSRLHMAAGPAPGSAESRFGLWPFADGAGHFPQPPPPPLERMIEVDVSDPTNPISAGLSDLVGWPSAAAAADGRLFTASGFARSYAMRLVITGDQARSLPIPAIARGAAAVGPQVSLAAGDGGLLVAHAEHAGGPLPSPTAFASVTPRPTRTATATPDVTPGVTASATPAAHPFTALLPLVRALRAAEN